MKAAYGQLIGVGVGPGDPENLTLKAVRILQESDLLILPAESRDSCRAYQIAVQAVPEIGEKPWVGFDFPMIREKAALEAALDGIYGKIRVLLKTCRQAAFLTIGDPLVYSTWCYLQDRALREGLPVSVVSGIPSFTACAARFPMPLAESREEIHILPGSARAEEVLKLPGTLVFMKSGRELRKLLAVLKQTDKSVYAVSDCGMETEKIYRSAAEIPEDVYMLTVIVK